MLKARLTFIKILSLVSFEVNYSKTIFMKYFKTIKYKKTRKYNKIYCFVSFFIYFKHGT